MSGKSEKDESDRKRKERNKRLRGLYGTTSEPRERTVTEKLGDWWSSNMSYEGRLKRK